MKRKGNILKFLVILAILILIIPSIQTTSTELPNIEKSETEEEKKTETGGTILYTDCTVWISGKCKSVWGALTWLFGFYCPLLKKQLWIQATGQEGEKLNVLVTGDGVGTYYDYENILIHLSGATGLMYWFGKSWIFPGDRIFARAKADRCWVTV